ncbi:MAG: ATP-binding protein [Gemmataceae bacterium]|nr:ATP-binding protein [Gemmataceae bacterium]MCI0743292.1 ATP-binding protein [Gemmataceae bacterium]
MLDLKVVYRNLDPAKPLDDPLPFYVKRPSDPVGILAEELKLTESPLHVLLIGQRGVGKSTELNRLRRELHYWNTFQVDLFATRFPLHELNDLLYSLVDRFADSMLRNDEQLPQFKSDIQIAPARYVQNKSADASPSSLLGRLVERFRDRCKNSPNLLLDGCERLPAKDLEVVIGLFARLQCSVVLAAPIRVALDYEYASSIGEWDRLVPLPAISVLNEDGRMDKIGVELLKSVVTKRAGDESFEWRAIELLVEESGGIYRDLMTLAQQACIRAATSAKTSVTEQEVIAAVEQRRQEYSFYLTPEDVTVLKKLLTAKRITRQEGLIPLLERNLIVSYQGDWTRFAVHPIVRPLLAHEPLPV